MFGVASVKSTYVEFRSSVVARPEWGPTRGAGPGRGRPSGVGPRHRQRVKRSRGKIVLITLATVVVVIVAAVAGDYWYINHLIHHVNIPTETTADLQQLREHPAGRLHDALRTQGAEQGVRALLPGGDRRQQ